jgi:dUTP pyrophosphatase
MNGFHPIIFDDFNFAQQWDPLGAPLKFKQLDPRAVIPTRATSGAACFDLTSCEDVYLKHYRPTIVVGTGIAIELPKGYVGLVCSRSGLAAKQQIFVLNAPGIIDEDYRGEIKVILSHIPSDHAWPNMTPIHLPAGSRIAQLMVLPLPKLHVITTTELSETARADGGLGSTGIESLQTNG